MTCFLFNRAIGLLILRLNCITLEQCIDLVVKRTYHENNSRLRGHTTKIIQPTNDLFPTNTSSYSSYSFAIIIFLCSSQTIIYIYLYLCPPNIYIYIYYFSQAYLYIWSHTQSMYVCEASLMIIGTVYILNIHVSNKCIRLYIYK